MVDVPHNQKRLLMINGDEVIEVTSLLLLQPVVRLGATRGVRLGCVIGVPLGSRGALQDVLWLPDGAGRGNVFIRKSRVDAYRMNTRHRINRYHKCGVFWGEIQIQTATRHIKRYAYIHVKILGLNAEEHSSSPQERLGVVMTVHLCAGVQALVSFYNHLSETLVALCGLPQETVNTLRALKTTKESFNFLFSDHPFI